MLKRCYLFCVVSVFATALIAPQEANSADKLVVKDGGGSNVFNVTDAGDGNFSGNVGIGATSSNTIALKSFENQVVADSAATKYTGAQVQADIDNSIDNNNLVYGVIGAAITRGLANYNNQIRGLSFETKHLGTGQLWNVWGIFANPRNESTGSIQNMKGIQVDFTQLNPSGSITNLTGLYINNAPTTGTVTNKYGIYQVDSSMENFFGGTIQMGGGAYSDGLGWYDASSREYKENIAEVSADEAMETIQNLQPVTFNYKKDKGELHAGFVAEDVPDLVATKDRKSLKALDITAVLTKVVQEQQKTIAELQQKLAEMEVALQFKADKDTSLARK